MYTIPQNIFSFFFVGFLINASLIVTFLTFEVTQSKLYIYFIFGGLWGMADGIWQTQLNCMYDLQQILFTII